MPAKVTLANVTPAKFSRHKNLSRFFRLWVQAEHPEINVISARHPTIPSKLLMTYNFTLEESLPDTNGLLQIKEEIEQSKHTEHLMKSGAPGEANVKNNERPVVVSKTFRYSLEDEFDKKMSFDTWFQEEVILRFPFEIFIGFFTGALLKVDFGRKPRSRCQVSDFPDVCSVGQL